MDDVTGGANEAGSVYTYTLHPVFGWSNEQRITAIDASYEDKFGISVAMEGTQLVVGAYHDDDPVTGYETGSAYIFCRAGGVWSQCHKLLASDHAGHDLFGSSVGLSGDVIVVGAPEKDDPVLGSKAGAAYVFRRKGSNWIEEQKLLETGGQDFARFGTSVAVAGSGIVIGAPGDKDTGSAFSYRHVGGVGGNCGWVDDHWLAEKNASSGDLFGGAAAMSGNNTIIGARHDDVTDSGAAFLFNVAEVTLDIDPQCVTAGQKVTFTVCCGRPSEPVMLAVVTPAFLPVLVGIYAADCRLRFSATAPPGLEGVNLFFKAFEVVECPSQVAASNSAGLSFKFTCP
jgi:hypothetical protein